MKKIILFASLISLGLVACEEPQNDDVVKTTNRDGAVEISAETVQHKDSTIIKVNYAVYNHGTLVANQIILDTVPGLGSKKVDSEDSEGKATKISVPVLYEFYVTVK